MLLIVEDNAVIRDALEAMLSAAGFEIVSACGGDQAMAELNSGGGRFKAVITDIELGKGPDGWEVGRHARELVPEMAIVYVTADGHMWPSKGVPGSVLVSKKFASAQVISAVSTLLNEADAHLAVSGGFG